MIADLVVTVDGWTKGALIPARFAFCKPDPAAHVAMSDNINPAIS